MRRRETERPRSGHLALLVLLIAGLVCALPAFATECLYDWQCDDEVWCNGDEFCGAGNPGLLPKCYDSVEGSPCGLEEICIEEFDQCVDEECDDDGDCTDGLWCNGQERCVSGLCIDGIDQCPDMYCDEPADMCRPDECTIPDGDPYISHFTGLNCTGVESYYTLYFADSYNCRPHDTEDVLCGVEERIETNKSYRDQYGNCYNAWASSPNTLSSFARVYREGIPAGDAAASYFTGPGCTGTEYSKIDSAMDFLCSPDDTDYAVCGKEMNKETVMSVRLDGVCQDSWPEGLALNGLVEVYRGCGVYETSECGDGVCAGNETCVSCDEDCESCCVPPDGEEISYFSGYSCAGTEYYEVPAGDFEYECAPVEPAGAVCGTVMSQVAVLSYRTKDWCVHSLPLGTQIRGLVRVYRDACFAEEAPECGDGTCNGIETCAWCPGDCGGPCCGDGMCTTGECSACPGDCTYTDCCGNGTCDSMESCLTCEADCGECPVPVPYCGDRICNGKETVRTCPTDCARTPAKPVQS